MDRARKTVNCCKTIFAWSFGIAAIVFLITGIKFIITDSASLFLWISMWAMLASDVLFFIAFFVAEALPKGKTGFGADGIKATGDPPASNYGALVSDLSKDILKKALKKTGNPVKKRAGWMNDHLKRYIGDNFFVWPVSRIFILESKKRGGKAIRTYLMVLGKRYKYIESMGHEEYPLAERITSLDEFLKDSLLDGEKLSYKNEAFCIEAANYALCYYVEAYRKNPDKKCYMDQGKPKVEALYNNGASKAFDKLQHEFSTNHDVIEKVFHDMNDENYEIIYPNARERFVALCNKLYEL